MAGTQDTESKARGSLGNSHKGYIFGGGLSEDTAGGDEQGESHTSFTRLLSNGSLPPAQFYGKIGPGSIMAFAPFVAC